MHRTLSCGSSKDHSTLICNMSRMLTVRRPGALYQEHLHCSCVLAQPNLPAAPVFVSSKLSPVFGRSRGCGIGGGKSTPICICSEGYSYLPGTSSGSASFGAAFFAWPDPLAAVVPEPFLEAAACFSFFPALAGFACSVGAAGRTLHVAWEQQYMQQFDS